MGIIPYHKVIGKAALRETRVAYVHGQRDLPDGEYAFVESYCDDPACDCRRVLLNVFRREGPDAILATISYGWEDASFYQDRPHSDRDLEDRKGPYLDPINPQSDYSSALLLVFKEMLQDQEYVERFSKHYARVKRENSPP